MLQRDSYAASWTISQTQLTSIPSVLNIFHYQKIKYEIFPVTLYSRLQLTRWTAASIAGTEASNVASPVHATKSTYQVRQAFA